MIAPLFCDLLGEVAERFGVLIHGYALMPNHYHLMVESVYGNLSKANPVRAFQTEKWEKCSR